MNLDKIRIIPSERHNGSGYLVMANWWYANKGQRRGPVSEEQLQTLISSGQVGPTDLVWTQGMTEWQAANQAKSLKESRASELPLPGRVNDTASSTTSIINPVPTILPNIPAIPTPVAKPKKPLLAKWAIIPVIMFFVVEVLYGWGLAKARASAPDYALSFFAGRLIGGVSISLVIAWGMYRLLRRSTLAGSIAFSVMLVLFCFSTYNDNRTHRSTGGPMPVPRVGAATPIYLPTFGISLASPPGWQRLQPDKPRIVARWVSPESSIADVQGMILVESVKAPSSDGGDVARELAKGWNGRVASEHEDVDGERAWRVLADPIGAAMQPVEGLVMIHGGHTFLIEGGTTRSRSCHEQIESVRRSWKWITVDPPTRHLEFRDQPLVAFDGKILVNFPAMMSSIEEGQPTRSISLGLYSLKRDAPDFDALIQMGELTSGDKFDTATERLGKGIQDKFKLSEPFVWHDIKSSHQGAITQPSRGPSEGGVNWIIWAMVMLDERRFVLINFTIYSQDQIDRSTYADTAQRIAESVSLAQVK